MYVLPVCEYEALQCCASFTMSDEGYGKARIAVEGSPPLQGHWRPVLACGVAIAVYTALQALWSVSVDHCVLQRAALSQPGEQALPLECFHAAELCIQ